MDYEYDVFVSYKRQAVRNEWIVDYFLPQLVACLEEEVPNVIGRPLAPIVIDQAAVNPQYTDARLAGVVGFQIGDDWRTSLKHVISKARCLIAIWSPAYFLSDICLAEWHSFRQRDMVVPLSVHDGESFPAEAGAQHRANMNAYFLVGPALRQSQTFLDFQNAMKQFSVGAARKIAQAPQWQDWPLIEKDPPPPPPTIALTTFAHGKSTTN